MPRVGNQKYTKQEIKMTPTHQKEKKENLKITNLPSKTGGRMF
jgi:hypothetical protein